MTVFRNRHRGSRWRFDFWSAGKRYQGPCIDAITGEPATDRREAVAHEAHERARVHAGEKAGRSISRPGTFTLGQALLLHLEHQVGSSPVHVANLKLSGRRPRANFGADTPVSAITQAAPPADYRRLASGRAGQGMARRPEQARDGAGQARQG